MRLLAACNTRCKCPLAWACVALLAVTLSFQLTAQAEQPHDYVPEIAHLALEDLLNQEVSSVLRKEEPLSEAPSAIYVLTAEDIRRSGAQNIPEALRLVPGITVVQEDSNSWQVTTRGFDSDGTAKLLVLVDGRSVYSPLFSGVFWDVQDVMLEDIDRIEVIRGPGAVSWGENAVNGVINIISRDARDTQGGLVSAGGGKEQRGFGSVRYGGKIGEDTDYRIYSKYFNRGEYHLEDGQSAQDGWDMLRGGFRADSRPSSDDHITWQGDIYDGKSAERTSTFTSFAPPFREEIRNRTKLHGGNTLLRYTHDNSTTSQIALQGYFDRTYRSTDFGTESRDTYDLDFQHRFQLSESHDFVYGADYRITSDEIQNSTALVFDPSRRTDHLATAFVQDEYSIVKDVFSLIPGTKIGHNDYTHFEYQPALKAVWTPRRNQTLWASVSRAVRTPARIDEDVTAYVSGSVLPDGTSNVLSIKGNREFDSEDLMAYEIGYRAAPYKNFSFDIATFWQEYDHLLSLEPGSPYLESSPAPAHLISPYVIGNNINGRAYGVETFATWRVLDNFTLSATYTFTELSFSQDSGAPDPFIEGLAPRTPRNQATVRAHFNLPWDLEFDSIAYYVDSIPAYDVPSYIRTDARIGWKATPQLSFDLIGQNLFDARHREFGPTTVEIERAYFGRVTYRFGGE
ncbi:MAG: TonB-dependent receptor [Deltaproteobacteria bacterium]|nr:TonB-dependent receptor [Deltaproteobacteria bacterium]